jgi:DNA-binding CsgD family transcriptional regulator
MAADERPAARRALQTALALAEPLDALRPFAHAGPSVRELLVHQLGSFGTTDTFAQRALAAGTGDRNRNTTLSERELTVLALLPSMLSLDEIATDLTVSVNTVKSHVRSIYTKLGVRSRRTAVLSAHESGLLSDSKIHVDDDFHTARKGAMWGAVGGAVIGLIFPPTLLAGALVGAGVGGGVGALVSHGNKEEIKAEVEDTLPLNSSGIVALFEEQWASDIERALPSASNITKEQVDQDSAAKVKTAVAENPPTTSG